MYFEPYDYTVEETQMGIEDAEERLSLYDRGIKELREKLSRYDEYDVSDREAVNEIRSELDVLSCSADQAERDLDYWQRQNFWAVKKTKTLAFT